MKTSQQLIILMVIVLAFSISAVAQNLFDAVDKGDIERITSLITSAYSCWLAAPMQGPIHEVLLVPPATQVAFQFSAAARAVGKIGEDGIPRLLGGARRLGRGVVRHDG